jgi:hypothetical protein
MKQTLFSDRRVLLGLSVAGLLLSGCAKVNDTGLRLVSTKVDALLLVNGQVLTGTALLIPDRTGRVSFAKQQGPITNCAGSMRYTASNAGEIDLRCNDGTQVAVQTTQITETRGYGYGSTPEGTVSLTFGLTEEDAKAFLRLPAGKTLAPGVADGEFELKDVPPKGGATP